MLDESRQVLWTQGLFLQPHHFQVADMAVDARIRAFSRGLEPWPWGVWRMRIAADSLLNNQFSLVSIDAVFQDGGEIAFPGNSVLASRSFEDAWTQVDRPFMVYLGLRRFDPNANNVVELEDGDPIPKPGEGKRVKRFVSYFSPAPTPDLYGDSQPEAVRRLWYSPGIYWENEINDIADCDFLPLARLIRLGDKPVVDQSFVPPTLNVQNFPALRQVLLDVRDQLLGRAARLEEYKPASKQHELESSDSRYLVMVLTLMILNRNIPFFEYAQQADNIRPWLCYLHLRQLAAELSSLIPGVNALGENDRGENKLPDYNHLDPMSCFHKTHFHISQLLAGLAAGPEHMIRFEPDQGGLYIASPPEDFYSPDFKYYLMVRSAKKTEIIREETVRFGKLGSLASIRYLVAQAIPGVPLRALASPPLGLPRREDTAYFEISAASPLWREAAEGEDGSLAFSWPEAAEEMTVNVVAMRIDRQKSGKNEPNRPMN